MVYDLHARNVINGHWTSEGLTKFINIYHSDPAALYVFINELAEILKKTTKNNNNSAFLQNFLTTHGLGDLGAKIAWELTKDPEIKPWVNTKTIISVLRNFGFEINHLG